MKKMECSVEVDSTTDKKAEKNSFTVVLKGKEYMTYEDNGYEIIGMVEVTHTVKCESKEMARRLGIDKLKTKKLVVLKNRDEELPDFEPELPDAMQEKLA